MNRPLDLAALQVAYREGLQPAQVLHEVYAEIARRGERPVWISLRPEAEALARAAELVRRRDEDEDLPLFGVPFAVKDNIDVAGLPTTAGCPAFAYMPQRSAFVVERLEAAGAIVIGKTNLDQFATGLVGTRTPYGIPSSVFDERYVSGGSSSGSGVAVAAGMVSFALGTDTAGSGRVPAAFNNIVGLKPTRGWLSTRGVVPACRSLDCVSVFAGTAEDALAVARLAGGFDQADAFSRTAPAAPSPPWPERFRFAVSAAPLEFFGDREAEALYCQAVQRLESLGGTKVEIDPAPFLETAALLYGGPWVAERFAAIKSFAESQAEAMDPTVRGIILGGAKPTAAEAFAASYRLAELRRRTEATWQAADVLLLPTAPTIYRIAEILADPLRLNINLGRYTNFVNLLDLAAIAVPAGFRGDGLPFGVTLIARAFEDGALAGLAGRLHRALPQARIGATPHPLPPAAASGAAPVALEPAADRLEIAVVGAHLSGEPLNHQMIELGAWLVRAARTAPGYRLYALAGSVPPKPGLVFDGSGRGGIELEVWSLPRHAVGAFIAQIPPPLGIATLRLDDGSAVKGFICEAHGVVGAEDITGFGGWRAYLHGLPATTA